MNAFVFDTLVCSDPLTSDPQICQVSLFLYQQRACGPHLENPQKNPVDKWSVKTMQQQNGYPTNGATRGQRKP